MWCVTPDVLLAQPWGWRGFRGRLLEEGRKSVWSEVQATDSVGDNKAV